MSHVRDYEEYEKRRKELTGGNTYLDSIQQIIYAHNQAVEVKVESEADCKHAMIPSNKIIATSYGDWDFHVSRVPSSHFSTRKDFDEIMLEWNFYEGTPEIFERIPLVEVFQKFTVTIKPNMDYLLQNSTEEQKDKVVTYNWMDGKEVVERNILNSFLVSLFGVESKDAKLNDSNQLCVRDFHFYYVDGNSAYGTAQHGQYCIFFAYGTS